MKLECEKLTKTIVECFDNSMDDRFTPEERSAFLTQGKELRDSLVNLLSTEFQKGTKKVLKVNKKIEKINNELKEKDQLLKDVAGVTDDIAELLAALDDLLKLGAGAI